MGEAIPRVAGSHDIEGVCLLHVDDLLDSTMDGIHDVVMACSGAGILAAHFEIAVPLGVASCVEAGRFKHSVLRLPCEFHSASGRIECSIFANAIVSVLP